MSARTPLSRRRFISIGAGLALARPLPLLAAPKPSLPDTAISAALREFPQYASKTRVSGEITFWGHGSFKHDFMGRLIGRWMREFSAFQPDVTFNYRMYGTASAIGSLYAGAGNLAILGEEINPAAAKAFRRAKGYAPTGFSVATGNVDINFFDYAHMIFVHKSNPIARLSLPQLADIFGGEPQHLRSLVRTWAELGISGPLGRQEIQPYGWETDEDFGLFFRERVLQNSHRWNPSIREYAHIKYPDGTQYDHGQRIVDALADDPSGIAISNVRYKNDSVRPLPLAWTDDGAYVHASSETLIWQRYPLVRIIPAFIDLPPGATPEPALREFLLYMLCKDGQTALVQESGYLPISPHVASEERRRLS